MTRAARVFAGGLAATGGMAAAGAAAAAMLVAVLPLAASGQPATEAPPAAAAGAAAVSDIPPVYLAAFDRAAAAYGVGWDVLAGIYRVECDFGQSQLAGCPPGTRNSAGAEGPGQFLPGTWRRGLPLGAIIQPGPPAADGQGYATDGDGDGIADPWDPADAVASTARMLAANGGATDPSGAVFAYNHDPRYVAQVLALAAGYRQSRSAAALPQQQGQGQGPGRAAGGVAAVLTFARSQIGRPYQWGGAGPWSWDCSGLVEAAYAEAGVRLTHDAAAQYAATAAARVPLTGLEPGDLVFYGTSSATIHHVGIAVDATHMIDAPYTGADVRTDPVAAPDLLAATRPLA
ncbi:bifunctional lytic transglycosylase/C40 family peptidase [Acidiferrimicrobium sp. IK]|uniref:C40 family peptidase n=1 Tax=Acidiferrimicrobium sp. IK TaxID=2871700 RepID=UPI0021CB6999|nr:bifunctional lytic transglycosylase/C40 family peptidase [Acidiferrimicrobium sp. IK]MCU4185666.1 bifunctional lytic transglycosylase/C40 family peptidase [Acidiferrimicrobium sp. IK]